MHKTYEKEVSWKAGALAIAVHLALLGALLISFNWKTEHPAENIAQVELWDNLPAPTSQVVKVEPQPEPKPQPKIEPPPVEKVEPKPEPKVEVPQVDIALEKKKELELKKAQEKLDKLEADKRKKEQDAERKKKLDAIASLDDATPDASKQIKDKKTASDDRKKMLEAIADGDVDSDHQARAAASKGVVGKYITKLQAKIKGNVNNSLCGDGNPELKFNISLLPTGELSGSPKLTKSSGIEACDEAVARAIIASAPFSVPDEPDFRAEFAQTVRTRGLKFTPNNDN